MISTKRIYALLLSLCLIAPSVQASECPNFTHEQQILLRKAYAIGQPEDWGYTLAAIVWKESFVGRYVIRINGPDGGLGSYGVAHMQLTTAMWLTGETNRWRASQDLAMRMISDDVYAMKLSLDYLVSHQDRGWRGMIARYNGQGTDARLYSEDVVTRVQWLQRCLKMDV